MWKSSDKNLMFGITLSILGNVTTIPWLGLFALSTGMLYFAFSLYDLYKGN